MLANTESAHVSSVVAKRGGCFCSKVSDSGFKKPYRLINTTRKRNRKKYLHIIIILL